MNIEISIQKYPEIHLAAVKCVGVQQIENAYQTLISWATDKKIFPNGQRKVLTIYLDSFRDTPHDQVRMLANISLDYPSDRVAEGDIFFHTMPAGKSIVGKVELTTKDYAEAWTQLFVWMKENGYSRRGEFPFEVYHTRHQDHPEGKAVVEFCIPIR